MKHLTILVPEGQNNLSSIIGSYKMFNKANEYRRSTNNKEVFKIQLAGISKEIELYDGLFAIRPHTSISSIKKTDLIIIPALHRDYTKLLQQNTIFLEWIKDQYKKGAEVASICTGGFLLAATGLLDGRSCSTHWMAADIFKEMFPGVNLTKDKLITDENGIYTNGGAFSFLNLILHLIEKYYDRSTAIFCSKVFQIDMDRSSQSAFIIFKGQKEHGDDVIKRAQEAIENNIQDKVSFEKLSSKLNVSRRNFDRRFIKATGNTPVEYLQRVKIEAAKKAIESSRKNINEVMYEVGYSDLKAFREVFKKITGMSPLDYRNKYNKEANKESYNS